jgi:hypothetical protein
MTKKINEKRQALADEIGAGEMRTLYFFCLVAYFSIG